MVGFHQDANPPDLGPCHLQLNHNEVPVDRHETRFIDDHPLAVLDERLSQFPAVLTAIVWHDDEPVLTDWPR